MEHKELVKQVFIKRNGYNPSDEELDKFMNTGEYLKSDKQYSKEEIWSGRLLIIWFIGSIASLIIFSAMEQVVPLLLTFGHYFVVFGIMAVLNNKGVKNLNWLFILGLLFLLFMMFGASNINIKLDEDRLAFVILGGVFAFMGFIMMGLIGGQFTGKNLIETPAMICEHINNDGLTGYVLEYQVNGVIYTTPSDYFSNVDVRPVGSFIDIKLNPDKPEEIVVNNLTKSNKWFFIFFIAVGIGLVLLGLFV